MVWCECKIPFKCGKCKDEIKKGEFFQSYIDKEGNRLHICGSCWSQVRENEVG